MAGGARRFRARDVERLRLILALEEAGASLSQIHALVRARPDHLTGDQASRCVHSLPITLHHTITERKRQCEEMLAAITALAPVVTRCLDCSRPPTVTGCRSCPMAAALLAERLMTLIWEDS